MQKWDWKNGFIKEGWIDCTPGKRSLKISGWRNQVEVKRIKEKGYEPVFVVIWKTGNWKKVDNSEFFFSNRERKYTFFDEGKALSKFYKIAMNKIN